MDTIQKTRKIRVRNKLSPGCGGSKKRKKKKCSAGQYADDFLKQSFAPVTAIEASLDPVAKQIELSFKNSVRNISKLYGLKPKLRTVKKYPFSIAELYEQVQKEMDKRSIQTELVIVQEHDEHPVIATVTEIDIGLTLYYVPLDALWQLHLKRNKPAFNLLLSIYAYLYLMAGMPLLNEHNYIYDTYDMMRQSYEDNEDEFDAEEFQETIQSFAAIKRISPILNNGIANTGNLYDLPFRIEVFVPGDGFDQNLLSLAKKILLLWRGFPNDSFTSTNAGEFLHPDEEDRAYPEQFFSFCWAFDGWMMDQLLEWVNSDLQEKSAFDVPFSIQKFDTEQTEICHEFSYQKQLLELLNELSDILTELYE